MHSAQSRQRLLTAALFRIELFEQPRAWFPRSNTDVSQHLHRLRRPAKPQRDGERLLAQNGGAGTPSADVKAPQPGGVATAQFVAAHGGYPDHNGVISMERDLPFAAGPWGELVPYADPATAAHVHFQSMTSKGQWDQDKRRRANDTVMLRTLPVFNCPSMPAPGPYDRGRVSDAGNAGVRGNHGGDGNGDGVVHYSLGTRLRPRDIVDGMSRTALCSEWITAEALSRLRRVHVDLLPEDDSIQDIAAVDLPRQCDEAPLVGTRLPDAGWSGYFKGYNCLEDGQLSMHIRPPGGYDVLNTVVPGRAVDAADSLHDGIVNVCFCDGHVQSIAKAIDLQVWRQLGRRNDGLPNGDFRRPHADRHKGWTTAARIDRRQLGTSMSTVPG